jgi:hypothetical protein
MVEVAQALGLQIKARRWGPCPKCGAESASRTDRRLPVMLFSDHWWCVACRGGGNDVSLASWAIAGSRRPTAEVMDFLEHRTARQARRSEPRPEAPPKRVDPSEALRRSVPLRDASDPALDAWLARRRIDKAAPAGWLPRFSAPWWSFWDREAEAFISAAPTFPIILPACTGRGKVEAVHGISPLPEVAPHKTMWPRGYESRELLFAGPKTRAWLGGAGPAPAEVVVVEGATDFLTASVVFPRTTILGITSGSAAALGMVPKVRGQRWYVATDPDTAGQRYATAIAEALFPFPVYPFPLGRTNA